MYYAENAFTDAELFPFDQWIGIKNEWKLDLRKKKVHQWSHDHAMKSPPKRIVKIAEAWSRENRAASS